MGSISISGSSEELPLISIVLTTYNSEGTIRKVLEGILRQIYPLNRMELIIVDGGSRDATLEYIKNFLETYKHKFADIKLIIHDKNYGVSRARNDGIKLSRGEYILILDHDVYLNEDTVITLYTYLKNSPPKVAGVVPLHKNIPTTRLREWEETLLKGRIVKTFAATSCFLIKRSVIDEVGLYDETLGPPFTIYEDIEYGARIMAKGFEIYLLGTHEILHDVGDSEDIVYEHTVKKSTYRNYLKETLLVLTSLIDIRYRYAIKKFVGSLPYIYKMQWYLYATIIPLILIALIMSIAGYPIYLFISLGLILIAYITVLQYYLNLRYLHISLIYSTITLIWRILRATMLLIPFNKKYTESL